MKNLRKSLLMGGVFFLSQFSFLSDAQAADPVGWLETVSCETRNGSGWVCDPDNYNASLQVLIYDGLRENGGSNIALPVANISRSDVSSVCGGNPNHGFTFKAPWWLIDGKNHSLYAYARDPVTNTLVQLNGNPFSLNCPKRDITMSLTANPSTINAGGSSTLTWSSDADLCFIYDTAPRQPSGTMSVSPTKTTEYPGTCYIYGLDGTPIGSQTIRGVTVIVTGTTASFACTGSIPSHASMYSGDSSGLLADTAYTYSANNTGIPCQFSCDSGYNWSGGACVATTGGGTPRPNPDLKISGSDGPVTVEFGASYHITWSAVNNATACTGTGPSWDGTKAITGGNDDLSAITQSGTYTLTCTGPGGATSDSITVNIQSSGGDTPSGLPDFQAYGNLGAYKTVRLNAPVDLALVFGDEMGVGTKADLEVKFQASYTGPRDVPVWTDIGTKNIGLLVGKQRKTVTLQTTFSRIGPLMLQVCIDPRNVVPEVVENNNCTGTSNWSVVDEAGNGISPGAPGSACVGDTSKKTGICSASCNTASSEPSSSCNGGLTCCLGGSANNTGASCTIPGGSSGTCQLVANCNGTSTSVNTCSGGTLCCTTPASSGGDTPPASCPTYTGTIVTVMGSTTRNVIGSGPFASSSDLGAAAVFSGLISSGEWVRLSVDGVGLVNSFSGSTKNGVTSTSSGADCGQNISVSNYYCSGTLPSNSIWWTAADYNLQQAGVSWQHTSADTSRACEFHCNTGFTWSGSECVKDASSPAPSTCASQGGTGCAATCQGASISASDCSGTTNLCCKSAPPAPGCTPSSACAAATCAGSTCSDGCGGTVSGTRACSGTGFALFGSGYENPLISADLCALTTTFLTGLQTTVVVLAIVFIIIGALIYLTSAGDKSRITWAKKAILAAVLGLALAIAAPMFLREIGAIMGWNSFSCSGAAINYGTSLTLTQTLGNILSFLLALVGVMALIMLIVGAFMYITAGGETDRADTGKKIVKFAVIGIVVTLAGLVLIRQVAGFFA